MFRSIACFLVWTFFGAFGFWLSMYSTGVSYFVLPFAPIMAFICLLFLGKYIGEYKEYIGAYSVPLFSFSAYVVVALVILRILFLHWNDHTVIRFGLFTYDEGIPTFLGVTIEFLAMSGSVGAIALCTKAAGEICVLVRSLGRRHLPS